METTAWPMSRRRLRVGLGATLVTLAVALGLGLRIWALGRSPINSDEAVVGLMARHILDGHLVAFYWGQRYGGVEQFVATAVFAVFGASSFTLGLSMVLLNAVAALLVWRIGRRMFSQRVGIGAALLFWLWPLVDMWRSIYTDGFRQSALVLGLVVLLFSQRISDGTARSATTRTCEWGVMGLAAGLGWWATPEIVYFVVPSAFVLVIGLVRRRIRLRLADIAASLGALALGALPWLWTDVPHPLVSLHQTPGVGTGFLTHLNVLRLHVFAMSFGLQWPDNGHWVVGGAGPALEVVIALLGVFWIAILAVSGRALMLVFFALTFPWLYAAQPLSSFWQDGRYALYASPVVALLVVSGVDALAVWVSDLVRGRSLKSLSGSTSRRRWGSVAIALTVTAGTALTLAAATDFAPFSTGYLGPLSVSTSATAWHTDASGGYASLAASMERLGVHDVYAGYWVAYVLDFESKERLVATDLGVDRFPPYAEEVMRAKKVGWLFYQPVGLPDEQATADSLDPACSSGLVQCILPSDIERWCSERSVTFDVHRLGNFLLITPHATLDAVGIYHSVGSPA